MPDKKTDTVLYIGRFQPFHNGHFIVVKEMAKEHGRVIIAIGSAQESYTPKNPFTAGERYEMIDRCLRASKIKNCVILPIDDINRNDLWVSHVVSKCPPFTVVYSNNKLTQTLFNHAGYQVRNVHRRGAMVESGSKIRQMIFMNMNWRKFVPAPVVSYMDYNYLTARLNTIEGDVMREV